ncbi:MAG: hemerythrin family protein [Nitrospirota bacterium]
MQLAEDIGIGVPIIDKRHRELINRLDNLRAAIKKQVCRYTIEDMITFLDEYTEINFCEEEKYMRYYGYPEYASHREKHRQFLTELHFLKEELHNIRALGLKGSYELSVETVQVVVDWVTGHVADDDKRLGDFLKQRFNIDHEVISSFCGGKEQVVGGTVAICSICHKIRSKKGLWKSREHYHRIPSDIVYSHCICPDCLQIYYADLFQEKR